MSNIHIGKIEWKVHIPRLLAEILTNPGTEMLYRPIQMTGSILTQVADRCAEINDPILNHLMCRLALYAVADATQPDYDPEILKRVKEDAIKQINQEKENDKPSDTTDV